MNHKRTALLSSALIAGTAGTLTAYLLSSRSCRSQRRHKQWLPGKREDLYTRMEQTKEPLMWGGLAAAIALAGTGMLLLKMSNQANLKERLGETFDNLYERTTDFLHTLQEKGEELSDKLGDESIHWAESALCLTERITSEGETWLGMLKEAAERARDMAERMDDDPTSQEEVRELLSWSDKAISITEETMQVARGWTETLRDVIPDAAASECYDREVEREPRGGPNVVADFVEWAALGMNLWRHLKHSGKS
jgi:hypothetical protein